MAPGPATPVVSRKSFMSAPQFVVLSLSHDCKHLYIILSVTILRRHLRPHTYTVVSQVASPPHTLSKVLSNTTPLALP